MTDTWDPAVYERFAAQRQRPVDDLFTRLAPVPGGVVVDLGCGTGRHTLRLHRELSPERTVGVDSSAAMLERAAQLSEPGLSFRQARLQDFGEPVDVLFANASLQWVEGHRALLPGLAGWLRPGGQLAVQVPANQAHPARRAIADVERRFGVPPAAVQTSVCSPGEYASILHSAGLVEVDVALRVYGFELPSGAEVYDFLRGSLLTHHRACLDPAQHERFEVEARAALRRRLGDERPYFYAFERILMTARAPGRRPPATP